MTKRVIVFTAHPDDLEIACSGTCTKYQSQGYEILSIITVRPSAEDNPKRDKQIVTQELHNSYNKSQFKLKVFNTDLHPNGRPNLRVDNITMQKLGRLVEDAEIAILPNPQDYHQDHRNTFELAFPLVKNCKEIWAMHSWPYCLYYKNTQSNLSIDITDSLNNKQELLSCYPSALSEEALKEIDLNDKFNGLKINSGAAETFTIIHRCG